MTDKRGSEQTKVVGATGNPLGFKADLAAPTPGLKPGQQRELVVGRLWRMGQLHTSIDNLRDWYVGEALLRVRAEPDVYVGEEERHEMTSRWLAFSLSLSASDVARAKLMRREYSFAELEELACLDGRVLVAAARIPKPERLEMLRSFVQRAQPPERLPARDMLSALKEHMAISPTCRSTPKARAQKPSPPEALVRRLRHRARDLGSVGQELRRSLRNGDPLGEEAVLGAIGGLDSLDELLGELRVEIEKRDHLRLPRSISILSGREDSDSQVVDPPADGQARTKLERTALDKKT